MSGAVNSAESEVVELIRAEIVRAINRGDVRDDECFDVAWTGSLDEAPFSRTCMIRRGFKAGASRALNETLPFQRLYAIRYSDNDGQRGRIILGEVRVRLAEEVGAAIRATNLVPTTLVIR